MARATAGKTCIGRLASHAASSTITNRASCTRCGGLLVNEFYMDVLDGIGELKFPAKRCVQCGEVVDSIILINRQQEQQEITIQPAREMPAQTRMTKNQ